MVVFRWAGDHCGEYPARAAQGRQIQSAGSQHGHTAQRRTDDAGIKNICRRRARPHQGGFGRAIAVPHGPYQPLWRLHPGFETQGPTPEF